jgi:hypothetical protein
VGNFGDSGSDANTSNGSFMSGSVTSLQSPCTVCSRFNQDTAATACTVQLVPLGQRQWPRKPEHERPAQGPEHRVRDLQIAAGAGRLRAGPLITKCPRRASEIVVGEGPFLPSL